jgi:hypothetical protein
MTPPTIHLNGTSKQDLMDELEHANHALGKAYAALKCCAPNGRDYYVQGPEALAKATDEHMDRLRRVDGVRAEIGELLVAIDTQ